MMYELTMLCNEKMTVVEKMELDKKIRSFCTIRKRHIDGVKKLAYTISSKDYALQLYYEINIDGQENMNALNEYLESNDVILRHLIVRGDF